MEGNPTSSLTSSEERKEPVPALGERPLLADGATRGGDCSDWGDERVAARGPAVPCPQPQGHGGTAGRRNRRPPSPEQWGGVRMRAPAHAVSSSHIAGAEGENRERRGDGLRQGRSGAGSGQRAPRSHEPEWKKHEPRFTPRGAGSQVRLGTPDLSSNSSPD